MKNDFSNRVGIARPLLPFVVLLIAITVWAQLFGPRAVAAPSGEQIFKENCASCHSAGGNIVDPKKPLKGSAQLSSAAKFKDYLLKPVGVMAAFPKIANDAATLDALYKYCKTLK